MAGFTAEELSQITDNVARDMQTMGRMSQETADAYNDAKVGIKGFSASVRSGGAAVKELAGAGIAASKAMYKGEKGAAAFNDSLDSMSKSAELAGLALAALIPGGVLIKAFIAGVTLAVGAMAEYTKAANKMSDDLYNGFGKLSKSGTIASEGLTGLYNDLGKIGMGVQDLDDFTKVVGDASKDLALFGGTAFQGKRDFIAVGAAMQENRKSLMALGMSQADIAEGTAKYIGLQTKLGTAQGKTTAELADGARKYLIEQDQLTKMTGMSRKEIEDQMEAARSEQRFRAKLEEVRVTQGEEAAKRLERANILISSQSKEMGQAFRDITTGNLTSEATQKGLIGTNGELMKSTQELVNGKINEFETVKRVGQAAGQFAKDMNQSAQLGVFNDMATDYAGQVQLGIYAQKDQTEMAKLVAAEQEKQGAKTGKAADALTSAQIELRDEQIKATKTMQDFVFKGTLAATEFSISLTKGTQVVGSAMNTLADTVSRLTKSIQNLLSYLGIGEPERQKTKEEIEAENQESTAKAAKDKAFENASFLQKYYGVGLTEEMKKAQEEYVASIEKRKETELAAIENYEAAKKEGRTSEGKIISKAGAATSAGPAAFGGTPVAATGEKVQASQDQLAQAGLKIKKGDVQKEGASIDTRVIELAKTIQANLPTFSNFTGFNDQFHNEKSPSSLHTKGQAVDFTLANKPSKEEGQQIVSWLRGLGATEVIDEYNEPSSKATAGHIHAAIAAYADGGVAKTPQIALVGEKGPEAMIPLTDGAIPIKFTGDMFKSLLPDIADSKDMADVNKGFSASDLGEEFRNALKDMGTNSNVMNSDMLQELIDGIRELVQQTKDSKSVQEQLLQVARN